MTTDEKVELAWKIAERLVEIAKRFDSVTHSEWLKWCSYAMRKGLKKAIQLAQVMQLSNSLRPGPKQAYHLINQIIILFSERIRIITTR